MITFTAYGVPAPKGSMKAFMRPGMRVPIVTHDNLKTKPWTETLKWAAKEAVNGNIIPMAEGPLCLQVWFNMPRPKSLPKRVEHHTKKPDLDKLVRCVKDALTGIVWTDDAQVVEEHAYKGYATDKVMPGAVIQINTVNP
jgi:Holliday junction resolvase RusA-like endonuclease